MDRSGILFRRRCRVEDITRFGSDGCENWVSGNLIGNRRFFHICCQYVGVFDSKPDLSAYQTGSFTPPIALGPNGDAALVDPPPNPKLGLAPLSSELAFSSLAKTSSSGAGSGR